MIGTEGLQFESERTGDGRNRGRDLMTVQTS
jgi:hypothetical protein